MVELWSLNGAAAEYKHGFVADETSRLPKACEKFEQRAVDHRFRRQARRTLDP